MSSETAITERIQSDLRGPGGDWETTFEDVLGENLLVLKTGIGLFVKCSMQTLQNGLQGSFLSLENEELHTKNSNHVLSQLRIECRINAE